MEKETKLVFSHHNIIGKIRDSSDYYLLNFLSGGADIIDGKLALKLEKGKYPDAAVDAAADRIGLEGKDYLVNPEDEKMFFINSYLEFFEQLKQESLQIHFIPWQTCNLSCKYCPFKKTNNTASPVSPELTDAFFSFIDSSLAGRQKIITLSGGEPFLPGSNYEDMLMRIFRQARSRNIPVRINTNGYYLSSSISKLQDALIRDIRVSLDFSQAIPAKENPNGQDEYFSRVCDGITASLDHGYQTHLSIVIEKKDVDRLYLLAAKASESGWTNHPLFSAAYVDPHHFFYCNTMTELHPCPADTMETLFNTMLKYPEVLELNQPAFAGMKYLFANKKLPPPLFKICPGTSLELVFSGDGNIYPCTAAIDKPENRVGTYFPEAVLLKNAVEKWDERDISTIEQCKACHYQLACGSGCPLEAGGCPLETGSLEAGACLPGALEQTHTFNAPSCIPVKDLLEIGLSLYFDKDMIV